MAIAADGQAIARLKAPFSKAGKCAADDNDGWRVALPGPMRLGAGAIDLSWEA